MKITENDIRRMVTESVTTILEYGSYRHGYVKPDGNGMTGGHWGGYGSKGSTTIDMAYVLDKLPFSGEDYGIIVNGLKDEYTVNYDYSSSYDESTGYGSRYSPVFELNDWNIEPAFYDDVNALSIDDSVKEAVIKHTESYVENMDFQQEDYDNWPDPDSMMRGGHDNY